MIVYGDKVRRMSVARGDADLKLAIFERLDLEVSPVVVMRLPGSLSKS
jgi:hypothetical protein